MKKNNRKMKERHWTNVMESQFQLRHEKKNLIKKSAALKMP